ncbi:MAG: ribosome biogenesis GTPase Der [Dethiobacteria bacterium]|jgi:GTP-binding protein
MKAGDIVAIVGRPNVGKSTLFNRFVRSRTAIEEKVSGVTRDRLYGRAEWCGQEFTVVDTGGITMAADTALKEEIQRQTELAIDEATVIVFLVDGKDGLTPYDEEIATLLRKREKEVILAVNKIDSFEKQQDAYPFYKLGLGVPVAISAQHGLNIGDLLDLILARTNARPTEPYPKEAIKVAVAGRPNVGKSSLINKIVNEERVIVSDLPGTTRDAIDTVFQKDDSTYIFIDTAGIRRKANIKEALEYYSVLRSLRAIENSDVVLLLLDATEKFTEQDQRIAGYTHEAGRGLIFVINKWDLIAKDDKTVQEYRQRLASRFSFVHYAPSIFLSAKTGARIQRLFPLIDKVNYEHSKKIPTSIFNELLEDAIAVNPPPAIRGRQLKIYYGTQVGTRPPTFALFVNEPSLFHFSYKRYLENRIREGFEFTGTPLRFKIRKRK